MKIAIKIALFALLLSACAPAAPTPTAAPTETAVPPIPQGFVEGPIYINSSGLLIAESYPVQPRVHIAGDLPDSCHRFRAEIAAPNADNEIHIRAYSIVNPDMMCAQMLEPFDQNLTIGMEGAADGTYSVWLNGDFMGEFNYPG
jgi:hypothetical protein